MAQRVTNADLRERLIRLEETSKNLTESVLNANVTMKDVIRPLSDLGNGLLKTTTILTEHDSKLDRLFKKTDNHDEVIRVLDSKYEQGLIKVSESVELKVTGIYKESINPIERRMSAYKGWAIGAGAVFMAVGFLVWQSYGHIFSEVTQSITNLSQDVRNNAAVVQANNQSTERDISGMQQRLSILEYTIGASRPTALPPRMPLVPNSQGAQQ